MTAIRFLTNAPLTKKIRAGEFESLMIHSYTSGLQFKAEMNISKPPNIVQYYSDVISPVNNTLRFTFTIPTADLSGLYADVSLVDDYTTETEITPTEIRRFTIDSTPRKNTVRFAWLNLLGGIDHYTFTGSVGSQLEVERGLFDKTRPYPLLTTDRGEGVTRVTSVEPKYVFSDFETEAAYTWLSEIITSPHVWLVSGGLYLPVVIANKGMTLSDEKLFQLKLEYRMANQRISQNG